MDLQVEQLFARPNIRIDSSLEYGLPDALLIPVDFMVIIGTPSPFGLFHFRFSLIWKKPSSGHESIRLDIAPKGERPLELVAVVSLEHKMFDFSNKEESTSPFKEYLRPGYRGIQAKEILKIIFNKHELDQYIFDDPGAGCRHWCATVMEKLAEEGIIEAGVNDRFEAYERKEHDEHGDAFPMPRIKGVFYQLPS